MKITISRGATVNLGSYESARIDISCEAYVEDINRDEVVAVTGPLHAQQTREDVDNYVHGWLRKEVEKIEAAAGVPPRGADRFIGKQGE